MQIHRRIVRAIGQEVSQAADTAMRDYSKGHSTDEPDITGRLLGAISDRLNSRRVEGVEVAAKTLRTGRGRAAEEKRHGADIMGVVDISLVGFAVAKGFLAQCKKVEPGKGLSEKERERLLDQCHVMLSRTPDSFVFLYSKVRGVRVVPAISVVGADGYGLFNLYQRGVGRFFEQFVECFVGDGRLNRPDITVLDALAGIDVQQTLHLQLR